MKYPDSKNSSQGNFGKSGSRPEASSHMKSMNSVSSKTSVSLDINKLSIDEMKKLKELLEQKINIESIDNKINVIHMSAQKKLERIEELLAASDLQERSKRRSPSPSPEEIYLSKQPVNRVSDPINRVSDPLSRISDPKPLLVQRQVSNNRSDNRLSALSYTQADSSLIKDFDSI
jgi:hypothetical protein